MSEPRATLPPDSAPPPVGARMRERLRLPAQDGLVWLKAAAVCAATCVLATPLADVVELTNIAMLFLLAVLVIAARYGQGPALLGAFLAVASFDFFFVPPRFTFAVSDAKYWLTFIVMFLVALIAGQLTARYKEQAAIARRRAAQAQALASAARELSAALLLEQVAAICASFLANECDARARLLPASDAPADSLDEGVIRWVCTEGVAAGAGTASFSGSDTLYLPLQAPMRIRGVLAVTPLDPLLVHDVEMRRLLDTFASLVAIAVERIHYVEVAQQSLIQIESESLRNSLLAAISHDLRTPLAVLVGLAESLQLTPTNAQAGIIAELNAEAQRMSAQVDNLLDMARLQAGALQLRREWQPLEEVVGSALHATRGALAKHQVSVSLPDDLPLLEFDAVLIERVLANLLENAAKYTPASTTIRLTAALAGDDVRICVSDAGPGIPAGRETAIFQKFERGERESAKPGVGMGLAICRAIVAAHGGTIRAENLPGGGACFSFTLPLGQPPRVEPELPDAGAAA